MGLALQRGVSPYILIYVNFKIHFFLNEQNDVA